jgi:hypothetical protein
MTDQLVLIDSDRSWRMDSSTRERGIRGVNQARAALREARSKLISSEDDAKRETGGDSADPGGDSPDPGRLAPAA